VASDLEFPIVLFGVHRWFAGGSSAATIAITSLDQWDAELARGKPGDNVILISLQRVEAEALTHAGDLTSRLSPGPSAADFNAIEAFIAAGGDVPSFVRRFSPRPGEVEKLRTHRSPRPVAPW